MERVETIGNTKLVNLTPFIKDYQVGRYSKLTSDSPINGSKHVTIHPDVSILAKCEHLNPTGSIKDRIAAYMIKQAEHSGHLKKGYTLIESTSGNTGAAVAMIAAMRGYQALLVIPDRVSQEKQSILRALGAEVRVMPSSASIDSEDHYINTAQKLAETIPNSYYLNQYQSIHNAEAHYYETGPEIWEQTQGGIDVFVSVAGSGGTISGVGRYLKKKNRNIKVIAVDPMNSVYHSYFTKGVLPQSKEVSPSTVEGAGSDHLTASINFSVIDEVIRFKDEDALYTARWLANEVGILVGPSSGANVWAALQLAQKASRPLKIVTLFPDSGMKYLSKLYNDSWLNKQNFKNL